MTTEMLNAQTGSPAGRDAEEAAESDVQQFVIFMSGGEIFAVNMEPVQEIIRVPEVVKVPMAPPSLDGLANLRGKVLPIISLRRIFGFDECDYDDSTRALVIDHGQSLGFVVDRVASVVGVDRAHIEDVTSISSTIDTALLCGILKDVGGFKMVMVLDFGRVIAKQFSDITALAKSSGGHALVGAMSDSSDNDDEELNDELQLVSFEVAGQEYAVAIEDVQEIVQLPEQVIKVPHADSHVLGVMLLRNRLLPLVSLRCMFGLPPQTADDRCRIVVVGLGSASVGVAMDSVNEVLRVTKASVDPMPALLLKNGEFSEIARICRLDDGKRLVSIISTTNLFRHSLVKEALNTVENLAKSDLLADVDVEESAAGDDEQVVVFRLAGEEFGVPIESVQEIVRIPEELTHVPCAPASVEGVINLRGAVLPVIDQRRRLGLSVAERNDRQRIMVYLFDGVRTGFIVDAVTEVLKIPRASIEPAPVLSSEQAILISRVANLEKQKRMIQLIDPSQLIDQNSLRGLAAMSG